MTDSTKFKLLAAFNVMNQKISMATFDERLVLQKKVYLLQQLGLNLGNAYGWYLRGPYSRDVTNDGFYLAGIQNQNIASLEKNEIGATEKLQLLVNDAQVSLKNSEVYCLELIASLHFILKYGYPKPSNDKEAINQLTKQKPEFTKTDVKTAMGLLKKHGLK